MDNEDNSNDVVAINSDDDEETESNSDKPIVQLFKRLITSDCKQNTVLTNAQIVDILNKEFDVNLSELHELEGDIYLTIMKKYLKDWPQWDEFDRVISNLKSENKKSEMEEIFETKYISLKNYLKSMLDIARKLAKKTVQKVIDEKIGAKVESDKSASSEGAVVLEINASRNQLNQLFFRQPHPKLNFTVFNPTYSLPTQIQLSTIPIEAILNWSGVNITLLNTQNVLLYKRETVHELKHVLVNKRLPQRNNPLQVLNQELRISNSQRRQKVATSTFMNFINKMELQMKDSQEIYDFIKRDLQTFPVEIPTKITMRRYTNKYPYVRYLYQDVEKPTAAALQKYDLQLEETISPCYQIYFGQVMEANVILNIYCGLCSIKFSGENMVRELKAHFDEQHQNEKDWNCTKCNKKFPMVTLAQNWWCHRC